MTAETAQAIIEQRGSLSKSNLKASAIAVSSTPDAAHETMKAIVDPAQLAAEADAAVIRSFLEGIVQGTARTLVNFPMTAMQDWSKIANDGSHSGGGKTPTTHYAIGRLGKGLRHIFI
jgi:hypothetical protein